jgi:cysteinyl-tRNA synthetase
VQLVLLTCTIRIQGLGNAELLAEGEVGNALSQDNCGVSDKKGTADFALWKKSKEGMHVTF